MNNTQLNNPRKGLWYWVLICFFGSIANVEYILIFKFQTTSLEVLIIDGLIYGIAATFVAMLLSSPFILMIYLLARRNLKLNLVVYGNLVFSMLLIFFFVWYNENYWFIALQYVLIYYSFGFSYAYMYLKKEKADGKNKRPSEEILD